MGAAVADAVHRISGLWSTIGPPELESPNSGITQTCALRPTRLYTHRTDCSNCLSNEDLDSSHKLQMDTVAERVPDANSACGLWRGLRVLSAADAPSAQTS